MFSFKLFYQRNQIEIFRKIIIISAPIYKWINDMVLTGCWVSKSCGWSKVIIFLLWELAKIIIIKWRNCPPLILCTTQSKSVHTPMNRSQCLNDFSLFVPRDWNASPIFPNCVGIACLERFVWSHSWRATLQDRYQNERNSCPRILVFIYMLNTSFKWKKSHYLAPWTYGSPGNCFI